MDTTQKIQRLKDFMEKNLLFHYNIEVLGGDKIAYIYYSPITSDNWGFKIDVYANVFFVTVAAWRGFASVTPDLLKLIDLIREEFGDYQGDSFKIMQD